MLNLELVDALYAGLPKNKQQELIGLLFKRSKQTMSYFHRTKDISLSKFEILADFFQVSLDSLRTGKSLNTNLETNDGTKLTANVFNSDLINQRDSLLKENENLKERIADLQARIEDKDALIKMQSSIMESYKPNNNV
jgi:flagellar capping protein FliD